MRSICVFCGSSVGKQVSYGEKAKALGRLIAGKDLELVYGGGNIGLMREIADAVLAHGGKVTGVMPGLIANKEIVHKGLTNLHIVETMHERKALMAELSDAFVAMPGGFGTIDELFEIMTWNQLEIISKPVGLYNINGYFDSMLSFMDHAVREKFVRQEHRNNLIVDEDGESLLSRLISHIPVKAEKWIDRLKKDLI
jgi:uncharacterized protein (TIGR00730 family)